MPYNKLHRGQKCPLPPDVLISKISDGVPSAWSLLSFSCFKSSHSELFCKKSAIKTQNSQENNICLRLFLFKVASLQSETLSEKKLRQRRFPVNFDKFLGTPILNNNYERLLLLFVTLSWALMLFSFLTTYLDDIIDQHLLANITIQPSLPTLWMYSQ